MQCQRSAMYVWRGFMNARHISLGFMNAKSPKRRALRGLHECWTSNGIMRWVLQMISESKIFKVLRLERTRGDSINNELCFSRIYACKVPKASRFVIIHECRMSKAPLSATIFDYKCRVLRGLVNTRSVKCRISRRFSSAN